MILHPNKEDTFKAEVRALIDKAESYKPDFRFSDERKLELLKLASDNPTEEQIAKHLTAPSLAKLRINLKPDAVKHVPFISALIERLVGQHANAIKQFAVMDIGSKALDTKKAIKLQALEQIIEKLTSGEDINEQEVQYYENKLQEINNVDIQLEAEKYADTILPKYIQYMQENNMYEEEMYYLFSVGETFTTMDMYEQTLIPRICHPLLTKFLPGSKKFNIATSPLIVETVLFDILTLNDRFDLSKKDYDTMNTADVEVLDKHRTSSNSLTTSIADAKESVEFVSMMRSLDVDGTPYFDQENLIEVKKITVKAQTIKTKVFTTIIDVDKKRYRIESEFYKAKPGEKVEKFYDSEWRVIWYVPDFDIILGQYPIIHSDKEVSKSDNNTNLYSGSVKTINNLEPFSWLNNVEPLVHLRSSIFGNSRQLIADNLGNSIVQEIQAKPANVDFDAQLVGLVINKFIAMDSTQIVDNDAGAPTSVGNLTKGKVIDTFNLDNSGNVIALFNIISALDAIILQGQGLSAEALGDIGQNSSISNVNYAVQQSVNVNTATIKLYYNINAKLYQIIIDSLRFKNLNEDLKINELLGDYTSGAEIEIGTSKFSSAQLGVKLTADLDEIQLLQEVKQKADIALQQKSMSAKVHTQIQRSFTTNGIVEIQEADEAQQMQQAQQAQQEAAKAQQASEQAKAAEEKAIEELKAATDEKVAEINRERAVAVANIQSATDIRVAEIKAQESKTQENARTNIK